MRHFDVHPLVENTGRIGDQSLFATQTGEHLGLIPEIAAQLHRLEMQGVVGADDRDAGATGIDRECIRLLRHVGAFGAEAFAQLLVVGASRRLFGGRQAEEVPAAVKVKTRFLRGTLTTLTEAPCTV